MLWWDDDHDLLFISLSLVRSSPLSPSTEKRI